jgi:carbonyl reductase 1
MLVFSRMGLVRISYFVFSSSGSHRLSDALHANLGLLDDDVVQAMLGTNYYGTLAMTKEILPLIRSGGRLVNVCSTDGQLGIYPATLRESFLSASNTSIAACSTLMEKFADDVKSKKERQEGWPASAYAVSKAGEIAATKVIASEEKRSGRGRNILVNACCPGFVNTEMTRGRGVKTIDEGAKTPVLLALGDVGGISGEFWQDENIIEW